MKATIVLLFITGVVLTLSSSVYGDCGSTKTVSFTPDSAAPNLLRLDNPKSLRVFIQRGNDYRVDISASSQDRLDKLSAKLTQTDNVLTLAVDDSSITIAPSSPAKASSASRAIVVLQASLTVLGLGFLLTERRMFFAIALVAAVLVTPALTLPTCTDYQIVITIPSSVKLTETAECTSLSNVMGFAVPTFVQNVVLYETGWFSSPIVYDLDNDGKNEVIVAAKQITVYDNKFNKITATSNMNDRVYATHVVADLDGDGVIEIAAGSRNQLFVFEYKGKSLSLKAGWPQTVSSNKDFEIRGLAAADLNGDGDIELVATTTITSPDQTVWVYSPNGKVYQPVGGHSPAWPRYNLLKGDGNDADVNGAGQTGYGEYGLNVGIGNIDDDLFLEVFTTYDNHRIQAFKHDGVAINASPFYTNRGSDFLGNRLTWGQMFRFPNLTVEEMQYNTHTGPWWDVVTTDWLQFSDQAPSVADLDGDGLNEVLVAPSMEKGETSNGYPRTGYALMCYMGAYGDGSNSAKVHPDWQTPPQNQSPLMAVPEYPPLAPTTPVPVDLNNDGKLEVLVSFNDGYFYAFGHDSSFKWKVDIAHGKSVMFCSEPTVADLNQDGIPEIIITTFGDPDVADSGYLMVLSNSGAVIADIPLTNANTGGNGIGGPSAPTVADVDGDGDLEILVLTFDHGMDVFTVTSSRCVKSLHPPKTASQPFTNPHRHYSPITRPNIKAIITKIASSTPDSVQSTSASVKSIPYQAGTQMQNVYQIANGLVTAINSADKKKPRIAVVFGISGGGKTRFCRELLSLLLTALDDPSQVRKSYWAAQPSGPTTPQTDTITDTQFVEQVNALKAALSPQTTQQIYITWKHQNQGFTDVEMNWEPEVMLGLRVAALYWAPQLPYNYIVQALENEADLSQFSLTNVLLAINNERPTTAFHIAMDEYQETTLVNVPSRSTRASIGQKEPLSRALARCLAETSRSLEKLPFFVFATLAGTSISSTSLLDNMPDDSYIRVAVQRLDEESVKQIIANTNFDSCSGSDWLKLTPLHFMIKYISGVPRAVEVLLSMLRGKNPRDMIDLQIWIDEFSGAYSTLFGAASLVSEKGPQVWPLFLSAAGYNVANLDIIGGTETNPQTTESLQYAGVATVIQPTQEKWLTLYKEAMNVEQVKLLDTPLPLLVIAATKLESQIYSPSTKKNFTVPEAQTLNRQLAFLLRDAYINFDKFEEIALAHLVFRWNIFNFAEVGTTVNAASLFMGGYYSSQFASHKFVKESKIIGYHHSPVQGIWASMAKRGRPRKDGTPRTSQPPQPFVILTQGSVVQFHSLSEETRGILFGGTNMFDAHLRLHVKDGRSKRRAIIWIDTKHTNTGDRDSTTLTGPQVEAIVEKRLWLQQQMPDYIHFAVIYSNRRYTGELPKDMYTCVIDRNGLPFATSPAINQLLGDQA